MALVVAAGAFAATAASSRLALVALPAAALLPYAALLARDLRHVLLAAIVFDVLLQWDINLGYQEYAASVGAEPGLNISLTTFALAGLYALWAVERGRLGSGAPPLALRPARPLLPYIGISAASIVAARDPMLGVYYLALLLQTLLLFVYIVTTARSRREIVFILMTVMAAVTLEGALILGLRVTGKSFDVAGLNTTYPIPGGPVAGGTTRLGGTIGSPNTAAGVLVVLLPSALALLAAPVPRHVRILALAALGVGIPALILTGSRGGYLGFVVACAVLAVVAVRRGTIPLRKAVGAACLITAFALPLAGVIANRVENPAPRSGESRIAMAELASEMIKSRPLLGVGLNNVGVNIVDYAGPSLTGQFVYTIHDKYLLVAAESGVAAMLAFIWFLVVTIVRAVRCVRSFDPLIVWAAAGLLAGILGQMVHMTVDIFASRAQVQSLWLVAALVAAVAALDESPQIRSRR
jgi:putative inorganic carbon (HCO3(-)) transporter